MTIEMSHPMYRVVGTSSRKIGQEKTIAKYRVTMEFQEETCAYRLDLAAPSASV